MRKKLLMVLLAGVLAAGTGAAGVTAFAAENISPFTISKNGQ